MALELKPRRGRAAGRLSADFERRLEVSLAEADRERQRRLWYSRARRALALVLLIGPIVGWRLVVFFPGSAHVVIGALAWLTFLLDVGVHIDTTGLRYLGLQSLPTVVGMLLFVLLALTFLGSSRERQ